MSARGGGGRMNNPNSLCYVIFSLLIVNNLLFYVSNGHIFRPTINREDSCTIGVLVLFIDVV